MKNNIQQTKPISETDVNSTEESVKDEERLMSTRSKDKPADKLGKGFEQLGGSLRNPASNNKSMYVDNPTPISVQERFKLLIKEYYSLQEEPYEYSLNCDSEVKEVKEIFQKFKDLKKEIENKTYGCGKEYYGIIAGIIGGTPIQCGIKKQFLCSTCQVEKEADEKILKQIKEILK